MVFGHTQGKFRYKRVTVKSGKMSRKKSKEAIVPAILWGWRVYKIAPDRFELLGGQVALIHVAIIMYWPRG